MRRSVGLPLIFLCWFLAGVLQITIVEAQINTVGIEEELSNPCTKALTCSECIRTSPICAWCKADNVTRGTPRCDVLVNLKKYCEDMDISNPKPSATVTKDDKWTSGNQTSPPVQVKPQAMNITLRPREPVTFKLRFRQQENYPVDLYFLLDLSYGMFRQKEAQQRLIALGEKISVRMLNITNNFRLGFGTFVDKLLMPYTAWTEIMLKNRCPIKNTECRPPHDFRNQVNLGENAPFFARKMREALELVSQSIDDTEGGFDGLIQALDCNQIGWREVSRRIIVYSSNSLFHLAGSGKLGGATKQSDLQCSLNSEGFYDKENIYDYPSVSQIASKLKDKKANVIFAVMGNVAEYYRKLVPFLSGAVVGELEDNIKNIVDLISSKYYELRSRVRFQASNADNVLVSFKSKCKGDVIRETDACENLEIMDSVEFDVQLTVLDSICEGKSGIVEKTISIDAVGLNEKMEVTLKVRCECPCEGPLERTENSAMCSSSGTLKCGICECNEGYYGRTCSCDESSLSQAASQKLCFENVNDTVECSGKGECVCGECKCFPIAGNIRQLYSGDYCECNNYICPVATNDELCGGPLKGSCNCGACVCNAGWSGPDCDCSTDQTACFDKKGVLCNGNGTCVCGSCICTEESGRRGPSCEDCANCEAQCSRYVDCAQCRAHSSGKYNNEECDLKCPTVEKVPTLKRGKGIRWCDGIDVDGCTFYFTYEYTADNNVIIKAQETKECPEAAPVAAIVGGTVAAVVLIPLLIICLIILHRNHRDRKEYAEFMKERDKARWDATANPIYKAPKSTFQNPTYKGKK